MELLIKRIMGEIHEALNYKDEDDVLESDLQVARTILQQLGGAGRLKAMIGARDFVGDDNSLTFKFMRGKDSITTLKITLDPSDTYSLKFYNVNGKVVKELSDIYVDVLKSTIENVTGLRLSL